MEISLDLPAELLLRYAIPYALVVALAALLYRFTRPRASVRFRPWLPAPPLRCFWKSPNSSSPGT
jgi:hypothetical protein